MAAYNKFLDFSEQLARGVQNFGTDTYKVALSNTLPLNTYTSLSKITKIRSRTDHSVARTDLGPLMQLQHARYLSGARRGTNASHYAPYTEHGARETWIETQLGWSLDRVCELPPPWRLASHPLSAYAGAGRGG